VVINPFKPTAGKMPPILIGRQSIIEDFSEALTNGVGAPGRIMLVTGQRGFGKTVMLTEFRRIAKAQHWEVIGETASAGLAARSLLLPLCSTSLRMQMKAIPLMRIRRASPSCSPACRIWSMICWITR